MKKTATAFAFVAGLGAARVAAQSAVLAGSDTMYDLVQELAVDLGNQVHWDYQPKGSRSARRSLGFGSSESQEIAPSAGRPSQSECSDYSYSVGANNAYAIAADALVNVASSLGPACDNLNWGTTIVAQDLNGTAGIQGPASVELSDWRTVMRILYFGTRYGESSVFNPKPCDEDIRHTLIRSWGHLFKGGCAAGACTTGLRHAFRPVDRSDATHNYIALLGVPYWDIEGAFEGADSSPFCNGTDMDDNDPVRVPCSGTGFRGDGDEVCGHGTTSSDPRNNTLGVVLPVRVPEEIYAYGGNCGTTPIGGPIFGDVAWTFADVQRYGGACPNGTRAAGGLCKWPKRPGSGRFDGFDCLAGKGDKPAGSPSAFDGRVYNLWRRRSDGTVLTDTRSSAQIRANVSYYRIHQLGGCQRGDSTAQIGCFMSKDTCSTGFASMSVLQEPNTKALGIRSVLADGAGGVFESVRPPALTDPDRVAKLARYGLGYNLYLMTRDEFASTTGPVDFVDAQRQMLDAVKNGSPAVAAAASAAGFYTLPTPYPQGTICP